MTVVYFSLSLVFGFSLGLCFIRDLTSFDTLLYPLGHFNDMIISFNHIICKRGNDRLMPTRGPNNPNRTVLFGGSVSRRIKIQLCITIFSSHDSKLSLANICSDKRLMNRKIKCKGGLSLFCVITVRATFTESRRWHITKYQ